MSSISLQDLNKRFYATGMYGKLLNDCADIPCKAMENTDVLKKAVGEDTLIYEKKGQDAIHMAMTGLKNLYEQGKFTESEHSKECVRKVQRTSDSICAFIDESLVRAKGKRLKRSEVFHMYEEYCKENGRQGMVNPTFSGI